MNTFQSFRTITFDTAAGLFTAGSVGVIPTDTVYGIAARADNPQAVARFYSLKQRENKPGTLIAADIEQLVALGIKRRYLSAVEQYWPNPLSVIIPTGNELAHLHLGKDSLAVRIPNDTELRNFLEKSGPLITSSANHPGLPPANTVQEAWNYFGSAVDFYVDGGDLSGCDPSTVIRIVDDAIEVLREGALRIDENGRISR
jgi:tRNA threonylcarbamoyl adenosine modification protein (Sua5/YciO/YrdC/YwlC family)